ncbi:MAG TPA: FUSC family protein [Rubrobacteraceae bacterium]
MEPYEDPSWWYRVRFFVWDRLRSGILRLRSEWLQILQTGVAACLAWFLAVLLLGLDEPTFAPIAAVISLGLAIGERGRRVVELTLGVAFGVVLADFLVSVIGVGAVQGGILVVLAMSAAVFLGRGDLGVNEAAISAMILMITFGPVGTVFPPERFLEALIGGGVALLVNALLPINPERMVTTAAHPIFEESVAVLEETAAALDEGDFERAQNALTKARAIDTRVSSFKEALAAGHETARIAPSRRRALEHLEVYAAAADQIDLTVRHVRILARSALGVVRTGNPAPEPLPVAVRDLARATEALAAYLEAPGDSEEARRLALKAAGGAAALLTEREDLAKDMSTNAFIDDIISAAYDLLLSTGMDQAVALRALEEATRRSSGPDEGTTGKYSPDTL